MPRCAGLLVGGVLALALPGCATPSVAYRLPPDPVPLVPVVSLGQPVVTDWSSPRLPAAPPPAAPAGLADAPATAPGPALAEERPRDWDVLRLRLDQVCDDYGHFYSLEGLAELGLSLAVAGSLANSNADQSVRDWYQQSIRNGATDEVATAARYGGEILLVLPLAAGAALLPGLSGDEGVDADVREWGNRSLRAFAVGTPAMLTLTAALGASRPAKGDSGWDPFHAIHGVSGHTFVGAIPWLTAAAMTDDPLCQGALVLGSLLTGFSRINDDRHYLSQVVLGWGLAYLAVMSVNETETGDRWFRLLPAVTPDGAGVYAHCRF